MNLHLNLNYVYFSATGYTKMIIRKIGERLLQEYSATKENAQFSTIFRCFINPYVVEHNFTLPINRVNKLSFTSNDLVIVGVPVYAGRVPNLLLPFINSIEGGGAKAIAVVTFGNRNYDDALSELSHILVKNNFSLLGGGAFVAEHTFSTKIANGRPNMRDLEEIKEFATEVLKSYLSAIRTSTATATATPETTTVETAETTITEPTEIEITTTPNKIEIPGNTPDKMEYYKPIGERKSIDIRKVKPLTTNSCNSCGVCATVCPMGSIDINNPKEVTGVCIKCGACVQQCPVGAKYFNDKDYQYHVDWLIRECGCREAKNFIFY